MSKGDENERHGKCRKSGGEKRQHLKCSRNEGNRSRNEIQQRELRKAWKKTLKREELLNTSILVLYAY